MTGIQAAQRVASEKQCYLLRRRANEPGQLDAKPYGTGSKRGWFYLDTFTASAITVVYDALAGENKTTFAALPINMMATVALKLTRLAVRK